MPCGLLSACVECMPALLASNTPQCQSLMLSLMFVTCDSNVLFVTLRVTTVVFVQHKATHMTNNSLPIIFVYDLYLFISSHAMISALLLAITSNSVVHIVVTTLTGLCSHTMSAVRFLRVYFFGDASVVA